jgi:hypothetical protein
MEKVWGGGGLVKDMISRGSHSHENQNKSSLKGLSTSLSLFDYKWYGLIVHDQENF